MSELPDILQAAASNSPEVAVAGVGGWALVRVLGPTVTKIGEVFGDFTDYRLRNLLGLNEKVQQRLDESTVDIAGEDGEGVHPQVAHAVIEDASWIDDDLHQTYLAGLLVNGRGNHDSSVYLTDLFSRLTAKQIELHYKIYRSYAGYWTGPGEPPFRFGNRPILRKHAVVVDLADTSPHTGYDWMGLEREGLITESGNPSFPETGGTYAFVPSHIGALAFATAMGGKNTGVEALLLDDERRERMTNNGYEHVRLHLPQPRPAEFLTSRIAAV